MVSKSYFVKQKQNPLLLLFLGNSVVQIKLFLTLNREKEELLCIRTF